MVLFPGNPENPRKGHVLGTAAVKVASQQLGESIDLIPLWNIDPDDVAIYMNACEAMLMMSFIEGSPNVVKEALACDLPVIGVVVGDVPEMLDGIDGCTVCPRDPEVIGTKLVELLQSEAVCNGREILLQRGLDLASVANRVLNIYETALERPLTEQIAPTNAADDLSESTRGVELARERG